jgi:hypothetical protein
MKKVLFMTVLMIAAAFTLTSCGNDEPEVKTTATTTYIMTFSQDMLEAANLFVIYKAENGRNVMEAINSTWWTKTVTSDKFPAEFGVCYKFSPKTEADLTKEKYDLKADLTFNCTTNKGANYGNKVTIIDEKEVAKKKVVSTIDKLNGKSNGFKITENGVPSEANNLKYE